MSIKQELAINDVVHRESVPSHYTRIVPFTAVIHCAKDDMTIAEYALIQSAIVNAAHEIRRLRGEDEPFRWVNSPAEGKDEQ